MKPREFVVMLEQGVWIANWSGGDPSRTLKITHAKRYPSISSATYALARARRYNDYKTAEIYETP